MNNLVSITFSFLMGIGVGLFFFGVLLWVVNRTPKAKHPSMLMISSFFTRLLVASFALYLISKYSGWQGLLAATAGFVLTKFVFVKFEKPEKEIAERAKG